MPQLAMPLFATKAPVPSAAVVRAWSSLFPAGPRLEVRKGSADVDEYAVDGRTVFAAFMPIPFPNEEATHAVRSSWMWQGPDAPVREHASHAIVTAMGDARGGPIEAAWDVARLSAALLTAGAGAALYWGSARQVHMPKVAVAFAAESRNRPVPLWVGITISASSMQGPFSAATHGLEALGHKELEVIDSRKGIGDLRMTLLDVASYVLAQGPVLKHGQTFGPTAADRWSIAHATSTLVPGRAAIVLGIP
jgi:hypothetical protein